MENKCCMCDGPVTADEMLRNVWAHYMPTTLWERQALKVGELVSLGNVYACDKCHTEAWSDYDGEADFTVNL